MRSAPDSSHWHFSGIIVLAAGLLILGAACASSIEQEREPATPVVLLAVDGLEWDVLLPLLAGSKLPHLEGLMKDGWYGELETVRPTWSPVIWTTVATGKPAEQHGIRHFARMSPEGDLSLFTNNDRRTKAIWNIASDSGRKVDVIGWWMTWPVEPIAGTMVAQTNTTAQFDTRGGRNLWKGTLLEGTPGQVHPIEKEQRVMELLFEVEDEMPMETAKIFGEFSNPLSELGDRLWSNCLWSFRADATYLRIAQGLAVEEPPADLTMLYLGGPDVVAHRFWRYRQPSLYEHRPSDAEIENFGSVIDDYYRFVDRAIGGLVDSYGPETVFLIVSDHGMHPVNLEARFDSDDPPIDVNSAHHEEAPAGVLIAAGPGISQLSKRAPSSLRRQDLKLSGSVFDIAPTVLAMLRLPVGKDMPGQVMTEIFTPQVRIEDQPPSVATHDTLEFLATRGGPLPAASGDEERIEQLKSLGYLD